MRILVFGAGAVGSVLGGFLAKAGHEVTLLGRPWHLDVIRKNGLAISGLWGDQLIRSLNTATRLEELNAAPPFDWVLFCVKAHQTEEAARMVKQVMRDPTLLCAFQNGLGNYEALTQHLDPSRVALGRVIFGAEIEPGRVAVTVSADEVLIGAPDPRVPRDAIAALAAALKSSGVPSRPTESIVPALWGKALYNCALNGLSTLLEVPYGRLVEQAVTRRMMERIIEEAYRVAAAQPIALKPPTAVEYLELLFTRLIPSTAAHHSSMLQDLRRGRSTEIDAMNGAIVRLGARAGIPAPMNALVTRLVHARERFVDTSRALC